MISILVDTYNHERFIQAALDSVFAQSRLQGRSDYQLIVVDDGSTDRTPEILAGYGDRILTLRKPNGGQASAFAAGLRLCEGEIVLFLDGDDWWEPEKIARVLAEFEAHPACLAVGHGIIVADDITGSRERLHPAGRRILNFARDGAVRDFFDLRAFLGTSRLAVRRAALDRIGSPPDALTYEADEYFFTLLPAIGDVHILPDCLTWYRLHGANLYQASQSLQGSDPGREKRARRAAIFRCLADVLPARLTELGTPAELVAAIREPLDIEATRLELAVLGGSRRATFTVERRAQRWLASRGEGVRTHVRLAVLGASLVFAPQSFYSLRTRYAGSRLRRVLHRQPAPGPGGAAQSASQDSDSRDSDSHDPDSHDKGSS